MCNGTYLEKEPTEALEYLDRLAETNQSWDYSDPSGKSKQPMSSSQSSAGRYTLRETDDLNNKVTQLSRRLENMELHRVNEVASVAKNEEICVICERQGHPTKECPTIPAFKEVLHGSNQLEVNALNQNQQRKPSNSPYSETYNPGWRDHPNFRWRSNENPNHSQGPSGWSNQNQSNYGNQGQSSYQPPPIQSYQGQGPPRYPQNPQGQSSYAPPQGPNQGSNSYQPPHRRSMEDTLQMFMQGQSNIDEQNSQALGDLRTQMTKLTTAFSSTQAEKGRFPAQSQQNPQGQHFVRDASVPDSNLEQLKSITTLRSGKEVDKTIVQKPKPSTPIIPVTSQ